MSTIQSEMKIRLLSPQFEAAVRILGKRWTVLILASLADGPKRFCPLRDSVKGLSDPMLSGRLAELEDHGLVDRGVDSQSRPVKVAYSLTAKAEKLMPTLHALKDWAAEFVLDESDEPSTESGD